MSNCKLGSRCKNGKVYNMRTRAWETCPYCNGISVDLQTEQDTANKEMLSSTGIETDVSVRTSLQQLYDALRIPEIYREANFDLSTSKDKFFSEYCLNLYTHESLELILNQMKLIYRTIKAGNIPAESCYFYAGEHIIWPDFVYSCLRIAYKSGLSAVPYLSIAEISAIRDQTPQMQRLYENLTWHDLSTADVCFVYFPRVNYNSEALLLSDLITDRANHGLPTFVIGYWPARTLRKRSAHISRLLDSLDDVGYHSYGDTGMSSRDREATKQNINSTNDMAIYQDMDKEDAKGSMNNAEFLSWLFASRDNKNLGVLHIYEVMLSSVRTELAQVQESLDSELAKPYGSQNHALVKDLYYRRNLLEPDYERGRTKVLIDMLGVNNLQTLNSANLLGIKPEKYNNTVEGEGND